MPLQCPEGHAAEVTTCNCTTGNSIRSSALRTVLNTQNNYAVTCKCLRLQAAGDTQIIAVTRVRKAFRPDETLQV